MQGQPNIKARKRARKTKIKANSTKATKILILLRRPTGATVAELSKATDWQEHSVRGFISGTLKKRKGFDVLSEKDDKGIRRYRVASEAV
jgi:hypothetical protein